MQPTLLYGQVLTQSQIWVRVMDSVMFAGAFLLITYCGIYFLQNRNAGHRALLKLATAFFFLEFVRYAWSSVALFAQRYEISTWLITICMVAGWVFAGYLFSSRRDVMYTLTTSEHQDRMFKDNIADLRTITSGMVIRAETTEQKAVAVGRRYTAESKQAG